MARVAVLGWFRIALATAFGFVGGVYFMYTGGSLSWRASAFPDDEPLLPVDVLFDIHPVVGLGFFTLGGFVLGWLHVRFTGHGRHPTS